MTPPTSIECTFFPSHNKMCVACKIRHSVKIRKFKFTSALMKMWARVPSCRYIYGFRIRFIDSSWRIKETCALSNKNFFCVYFIIPNDFLFFEFYTRRRSFVAARNILISFRHPQPHKTSSSNSGAASLFVWHTFWARTKSKQFNCL